MPSLDPNATVKVVLFTGGRGSSVLSSELIKSDRVALTLAINGYDDGLSTGEVRRFLGDCLGPSDFRKNASSLAARLRTCDDHLISILDLRFPDKYSLTEVSESCTLIRDRAASPRDDFQRELARLANGINSRALGALAVRLDRFLAQASDHPFSFSNCSLGNLAFAGCFLHVGRRFNDAVDDYCSLLNIAPGTIENVTDGRNACLVAVDREGRLLATEAEIVTAEKPQNIRDIYLLDHLITASEKRQLQANPGEIPDFLRSHRVSLVPNPRLLAKISEADLIVYAPGTQHSSLFPSYMTPGIGAAIAQNLKAVKVLITNLQEDAEICGSSAVDLINRALFYLREKDRLTLPTPSLITHYVLNEPGRTESGSYVPLGHLDSLEDPRLVRIGNYEDGLTGRHDATKVLTPFIKALLRRGERLRLAVLLLDAESLNKVAESIVEMIRAGIGDLPLVLTVFYESSETFGPEFANSLPFDVRNLATQASNSADAFSRIAHDRDFDYVMLFESSGMYRGDDIVNLAAHLSGGRLDAVWGSRRLSVNDIKLAYRLVYRHKRIKAAISYVGSHVLSLAYLALYGRYISDSLSGVRVVRSTLLREGSLDYRRRDFNQLVLSALLRQRAEVFETPVYYFPISPEKIRRTTVAEGLSSLWTILRGRWRRLSSRTAPSAMEDMIDTAPADVFGTGAATSHK
ncbi:MAG: 2-phospho-L-lactate transferase CofD family protein [Gemmatimonadota bacterium]